MGAENVRTDFQNGTNGALVLTEENLNQLDEMYQLISPSREGETGFAQQLGAASDHLWGYVDARQKAVIGTTTYKEIRDLVKKIVGCGYFNKQTAGNKEAEQPEQEPAEETEEQTELETIQPNTATSQEEDPQETLTFGDSVPSLASQPTEPAFTATQEESQSPSTQEDLTITQPQQTDVLSQNTQDFSDLDTATEDAAYYSASATAAQPQRNFREIVSSVQGNFHFLQDSEIDLESPQVMDPAVVHITSKPISMQQHSESQSSYASIMDDQHGASQQSATVDPLDKQTSSQISSFDASAASAVSQAGSGLDTPYGVSDQTYSHDLMSQNLQSSSQHTSWAEQSALGASMEDTGIGFGTVQDGPPSIPMPNQSEQVQSYSTQGMDAASAQNEKKSFSMNPDAPLFYSSYNQTSIGSMGQDTSAGMQSSMSSSDHGDDQKSIDQGSYQNNQYGGFSGFGDRRGGNRGGGSRGGYRGGNRGNMSNGYTPRGGRGSGGGGGGGQGQGQYNGRREYNNRPNGRGGGSGQFQGYPPRSDYRPEGGYQSYNNGFSSSSATGAGNKRGGSGGAPYRGSSRGASVPRGGPSRGGFSGPREGRGGRGGFVRPNSGPQMTQSSA
eukprot:GHVU01056225.1.p1 GENE.GHVU01056225.1~~GHVU01056225.1.p1  ORF type:complete len:714 (-),score=98.09 GHVU01056225.1:2138-3979(-)